MHAGGRAEGGGRTWRLWRTPRAAKQRPAPTRPSLTCEFVEGAHLATPGLFRHGWLPRALRRERLRRRAQQQRRREHGCRCGGAQAAAAAAARGCCGGHWRACRRAAAGRCAHTLRASRHPDHALPGNRVNKPVGASHCLPHASHGDLAFQIVHVAGAGRNRPPGMRIDARKEYGTGGNAQRAQPVAHGERCAEQVRRLSADAPHKRKRCNPLR